MSTAGTSQPRGRQAIFVHMFMFRWRPEATDVDKRRAVVCIRALQEAIPGINDVRVGSNLTDKGEGFGLGGVMTFSDRNAYDRYVRHPAHQALLLWLVPLITAMELDFVDGK